MMKNKNTIKVLLLVFSSVLFCFVMSSQLICCLVDNNIYLKIFVLIVLRIIIVIIN